MKALIWSKDMCGNCELAKQLLDLRGVEYEERKIGKDWTKEQLLEVVPHAKSVPQVFIDNEYVGGLTELKQKLGVYK